MQSQIGGFAAAGLLENLTRTQTLCEWLADSAALFECRAAPREAATSAVRRKAR